MVNTVNTCSLLVEARTPYKMLFGAMHFIYFINRSIATKVDCRFNLFGL